MKMNMLVAPLINGVGAGLIAFFLFSNEFPPTPSLIAGKLIGITLGGFFFFYLLPRLFDSMKWKWTTFTHLWQLLPFMVVNLSVQLILEYIRWGG